jgi:Zn-finger nucleic acid-binding protein
MRCPADCDATLTMSERQGIEIDYCPQCRGVWLDRGELDKIIERSAAIAPAPAPAPAPAAAAAPLPPVGHERDDHRAPKKKKRGGFLEDLFDFG